MNNLAKINEILKNFDDADLDLVYRFVERLFESYESLDDISEKSQKTTFENDEYSKKQFDLSENSIQSDIPHDNLLNDDLMESYESLGDEELLERLMMWRRD